MSFLDLNRHLVATYSLLTGLLAGALALTCCATDETTTDRNSNVLVMVADREDDSPQAGVKLVLMDAVTNEPVRDPVTTGPDGWRVFRGVPPGRFAVLVFPGGGRDLHSAPGPFDLPHAAPKRDAGMGLLAPEVAAEPYISVHPFTIVAPEYADPLPRLSGRILDAETLAPLAGAFVSDSPQLGAYRDDYTIGDDVSDSAGIFTVGQIAFVSDPDGGGFRQAAPLYISRAGYWPRTWSHDATVTEANPDLAAVEIQLEPITVNAAGRLIGKVSLGGALLSGVPIGLSFHGLAGMAIEKSGVGLPGRVTRSDSSGVFQFTGLQPGQYAVHPGFLPGDGFVAADLSPTAVPVSGSGATDMGTVQIRYEVQPLQPFHGGRIYAPLVSLRWTAVPHATRYRVFLDRSQLGTTSGTEFVFPQGMAPSQGEHVWWIKAETGSGYVVGTPDRQFRFQIMPLAR
ncbi:MAG: hypothetical protein ABIF77_18165 [bacterium]